ncbi:PC4/YdbC family ssDNA-binding protein [Variovorax sp. ZT5P49]|uniref:PC4/YdbC family ssDNA-binding protein n=1 Tax=Variovorax sp. ZT5P49 TaxID=3443733 RepID=UPI003F4881DB
MSEVVARVQKSRTAEIRVTRDRYESREVVDIRAWFVEVSSGVWKPSGRGVQFDGKRLEAVIAGLQSARPAPNS